MATTTALNPDINYFGRHALIDGDDEIYLICSKTTGEPEQIWLNHQESYLPLPVAPEKVTVLLVGGAAALADDGYIAGEIEHAPSGLINGDDIDRFFGPHATEKITEKELRTVLLTMSGDDVDDLEREYAPIEDNHDIGLLEDSVDYVSAVKLLAITRAIAARKER